MAQDKREILVAIATAKEENKKILSALKKSADAFRAATAILGEADKKLNKNAKTQANEKLRLAFDEANRKNSEAKDAFVAALNAVNANMGAVRGGYNALNSVTSKEKDIKRQKEELEKFEKTVTENVGKLTNGITLTPTSAPAPAKEAAPVEQKPAPAPQPAETRTVNTEASVASVNVAPVTIDVTPIVERAISAAMQKLSSGMDRRLEEYVSNINLPTVNSVATSPAVPTAADTGAISDAVKNAGANAELGKHVLEEEQYIFEKLTAMCEQLKTLLNGIADMSAAYLEIAAKQKEVAELQKQTNDMQRHTMREQQGVQVNQKLVNKEQIDLVTEQSLVLDFQRIGIYLGTIR